MAGIADAVRAGNWQRSGGKAGRPKPIPRPGVGPQRVHHGSVDRDPAEVSEYLGRFAPPPPTEPMN